MDGSGWETFIAVLRCGQCLGRNELGVYGMRLNSSPEILRISPIGRSPLDSVSLPRWILILPHFRVEWKSFSFRVKEKCRLDLIKSKNFKGFNFLFIQFKIRSKEMLTGQLGCCGWIHYIFHFWVMNFGEWKCQKALVKETLLAFYENGRVQ